MVSLSAFNINLKGGTGLVLMQVGFVGFSGSVSKNKLRGVNLRLNQAVATLLL
jgi:hypothetical protein